MNVALFATALLATGILCWMGRDKPLVSRMARSLCFTGMAAALLLFARSSPENLLGVIGGLSMTALALGISRFN
jgi:hypothetical protein